MLDSDLDSHDFYEAHAKEFEFLGERLQAVFYGLNHPQLGFEHKFLGVFRSLDDARSALEPIGFLTDEFLE